VAAHYHLRALLLADRPELAAAFPDAGHRFPQFFVRDVQVTLRLLDVGMAEHQLDGADVHTVSQKPAGSLVTKVVPVQIDLPQLGAIDARAGFGPPGVVPVGEEQERFPGSLEAAQEGS